MGSRPFQVNPFSRGGVDEHPIRLNVRISVSGPIEFERMVFVLRWQRLVCEQKLDQLFQLFKILAPLLKTLHVAMKLG